MEKYDELFLRDAPGVKKVSVEIFFPKEKINLQIITPGILPKLHCKIIIYVLVSQTVTIDRRL